MMTSCSTALRGQTRKSSTTFGSTNETGGFPVRAWGLCAITKAQIFLTFLMVGATCASTAALSSSPTATYLEVSNQ